MLSTCRLLRKACLTDVKGASQLLLSHSEDRKQPIHTELNTPIPTALSRAPKSLWVAGHTFDELSVMWDEQRNQAHA